MADDPFDPERLSAGDLPPVPPRTRPPRHRRGDGFLKGPVPWAWVAAAARQPGRALLVGLALWREAGCTGSRRVPLRQSVCSEAGCDRQAARRGLRALADAGLVTVHARERGKCLTVELLEAPGPGGAP